MDVGVGLSMPSKDASWFFYTLPAFLGTKTLELADGRSSFLLPLLAAFLSTLLAAWWFSAGGVAWANGRHARGAIPIPGLRGMPVIGSLYTLCGGSAHRELRAAADRLGATQLLAFSLGSTPAVVASDPVIAREILTSPSFADRPLKQSARMLLFERAMGFAPSGAYWKLLRRIASSHLFAPRRIAAHEPGRQLDAAVMLAAIAAEQRSAGFVALRRHLQGAALNSIMGSAFGRRYDVTSEDADVSELREMVAEGFELLGAFNWTDYLPWLGYLSDPHCVRARCAALVPRIYRFVSAIIREHKQKAAGHPPSSSIPYMVNVADFVDVLLALEGEEKLQENDMIAVLWEMIFRGTDTTALLTEWVMAELVLNPQAQAKLQAEIDDLVGDSRGVTDADVARLPYLQAVVKEGLRLHPPGPLLSWARLSTSDVHLSNGMVVPANTTAMVNMWAITHNSVVWADAETFSPERFANEAVDVRGSDLRLAPFGSGRRVCPGKSLGLATVSLWVAKLVHHFKWVQVPGKEVDLTEVLKLSCEMKYPLCARVVPRSMVF